MKQRLCATSTALKTRQIKNWLLRQELTALPSSVSGKKRLRGDILVRNLYTHIFSTETVFRLFQEDEEATRARKHGNKRQRVPSSCPDPLEEDAFL